MRRHRGSRWIVSSVVTINRGRILDEVKEDARRYTDPPSALQDTIDQALPLRLRECVTDHVMRKYRTRGRNGERVVRCKTE